tara:strand:- start:1530 stop:2240 length:711 start_codon:yes stop_codon:yes gene_type:complete
MSEEQTKVAQETATETQVEETNTEAKVETPKQNTFTQEQLDNIIKSRLEAEKSKYEKKLQEEEKQKAELLKQKQLEEAKTKQDLEKIMQERLQEKDQEVLRYKTQIKKEKVDNSILSIASKNNAINPSQVVALLKEEVKYTDDGRIEVVDNNSNVRYNAKGELFTLEDRVNEFLDSNPHFRKGSLSGSGSQNAIGGKTVKPLNIQDLDLSKPEDRKTYAEYRKKRDSGAIEINLTK